MRVTTDQIAEKCHVSRSTVSRVLNDYPHVDEVTRALVWKTAQELGYPPGKRKKSLHLSKSVLLLTRSQFEVGQRQVNLNGLGFERMVSLALQSVFERENIVTRVEQIKMEPGQAQYYTKDLGVTGLVLLGGLIHRDFIQELQRQHFPFVLIGAHVLPLEVNCVTADFSGGMEAAVTHLIQRGRKSIALVNGPGETTTSAEKYRGYRTALAFHNLPFDPHLVTSADFDSDASYTRTGQLLADHPQIDAIAYADDYMAMRGLRAIKASGRRIPNDIAITGFYNYDIASYTDPRITTVHVDMQRMGIIAAQRLMDLLQNSVIDQWMITVPTQLVINDST